MNQPSDRKQFEVLLVEDNEDDVFLLREAFRHIQAPVNLQHVENGAECFAFLRREGPYIQAPRPDLILLDLNMPLMDGRQALAELVADPDFQGLPVVVLTTSASDRDIRQMYQLRCSTYIVKPLDLDEFERTVRLISDYWFSIAALPRGVGNRP